MNDLYGLPDLDDLDYMGDTVSPIQAKAEDTVEMPFRFDNDTLMASLKRIYGGRLDVSSEIEEGMWQAVYRILSGASDTGLAESGAAVSTTFRQKTAYNTAAFSAFKVHRMQNDIAARLTDSNGVLKPFEQWLNDVEPMLDHHVGSWLRTEYDTAVIRMHQAADWQRFEEDADILPNLEWMPSTSAHPGADHRIFWGTVLPVNDPFWNRHRPGDRWNCKCWLKNTDTPATKVPDGGGTAKDRPAPGLDNNPGVDGKLFGDSHPYVTNGYPGAEKAVKRFMAEMVKEGTVIKVDYDSGRELDNTGKFLLDADYGKRLKTSVRADMTEVEENTRAAKALLSSFPKMNIRINEHVLEEGHKNPEYTINGKVADRKGIMSEKGIANAFQKAIKQGCEAVVIDLDMNMKDMPLYANQIAKYISRRQTDFENGTIKECYVIYHGRAVKITLENISREAIMKEVLTIKP